MEKKETLQDLGESKVIDIIDNLIFEKSKKNLVRDDCFFHKITSYDGKRGLYLVFNSDMLVSTTDVPKNMLPYQIGRKAVIMNISDLIVKGVIPESIIISAGFPEYLDVPTFKEIINGIIDSSFHYELEYIGGDINETKEIIVNPMVIGFQEPRNIIYRVGAQPGDMLITNGKFGLTGVGFDILLNKNDDLNSYPNYKRSIESVLKPSEISYEGIYLGKNNYATSSIDSSDGLARSLRELRRSNPNVGFEIFFNEELVDEEASSYSEEFNIPIEKLILNGGEEFIHIFTVSPKKWENLKRKRDSENLILYQIGKVTDKDEIVLVKENEKIKLQTEGFQHFEKNI